MRRFEMVQSTTETTTSHAGLALVGRGLAMTGLDKELRQIPLRHGIAHADCVKSYVGLLCTGKSDFDAIENKRNDTFFITALGIERVPSCSRRSRCYGGCSVERYSSLHGRQADGAPHGEIQS